MGVYDPVLIQPIAETMLKMGMKRAAVVHGSGLDEVAIHGETQVAEIHNKTITRYILTPDDFGLNTFPLESIQGGTPEENRLIIEKILTGQGTEAQMSAVAVNVALLLRLFSQENLKENAAKAMNVMQTGQAFQLVKQLSTQR
jgi:anthranilate phosphoribosyltransferase